MTDGIFHMEMLSSVFTLYLKKLLGSSEQTGRLGLQFVHGRFHRAKLLVIPVFLIIKPLDQIADARRIFLHLFPHDALVFKSCAEVPAEAVRTGAIGEFLKRASHGRGQFVDNSI